MNSDLTLPVDGGYLNIRVGAIILKDGRFLMVGNHYHPYDYSVGGRVRFRETTEQAVLREVEEETGCRLEIDRLGFVEENYFYADVPSKMGKLIYEISFYYYMITPPDFEPVCGSFTDDGEAEYLEWLSPGSEKPFYPRFFRTELAEPKPYVVHILTDDRN